MTFRIKMFQIITGHIIYITTASASQLFKGYDGNVFKPDKPISRAEVAVAYNRAFNLEFSGNGNYNSMI